MDDRPGGRQVHALALVVGERCYDLERACVTLLCSGAGVSIAGGRSDRRNRLREHEINLRAEPGEPTVHERGKGFGNRLAGRDQKPQGLVRSFSHRGSFTDRRFEPMMNLG